LSAKTPEVSGKCLLSIPNSWDHQQNEGRGHDDPSNVTRLSQQLADLSFAAENSAIGALIRED